MTQGPDRDAAERPRLSQAVVLSEAVSLADREGLEAVTIRRLAQDLGVTPMALYWHFRTKALLMAALGGRILDEVDLTVDAGADWSAQFHAVLRALVSTLRKHPWASQLIVSSACESSGYLTALEKVLAILRGAGFSAEEATGIARHALSTAMSLAADQPGSAGADEVRRFYETLPREQYPHIVEAAGPLTTCGDRDFGLDLMVAGVVAMAARKRTRR